MTIGEIILMALGLAMDAFAVSVAVGLKVAEVTPRHTFRIGFHFGLFQFLMPLIGWGIGFRLREWTTPWDTIIAFLLLCYVGGKMLWEAREENTGEMRIDPTRGWSLVFLSLATSIDAFAVGLSMALLGVSVWLPSVIIGLVTLTLSSLGICFGGRLGSRWGRAAEIAGGITLLLIGIRLIIATAV